MFTEPILATVSIFAGNFAPRGWAFCQGQLMSISQNSALFAIIGTTYGGDGQVTFGLPDLRGRVAIHPGVMPGGSTYVLGQLAGTENVTLLASQLPAHTHPFVSASGKPAANSNSGSVDDPTNAVPAASTSTMYNTATSSSVLGPTNCATNTAPTGQGNPVPIVSPFLVLNYVIALEGVFPSRN